MQGLSRVSSGDRSETQLNAGFCVSTELRGRRQMLVFISSGVSSRSTDSILRSGPIHSAAVKPEAAHQHTRVVLHWTHGWQTTRKSLEKHKIRAQVFVDMSAARLITTGYQRRFFFLVLTSSRTMPELSSTHYGTGDAPHNPPSRGNLIHPWCGDDDKL